ncbi:hypothetical protein B0H14DRAFT_2645068 [Mycena olivaceomarginata]|nr:hypothetical protein B0H14DRAFT_2645068 [Mycena olivaceomarginata]
MCPLEWVAPSEFLTADSVMEAEKLILVGFLKGRNRQGMLQLSKYLLKDAEERLKSYTEPVVDFPWTQQPWRLRSAFVSAQKDSDEFGERREVSIAEMFDPRASQNYEGLVWNHTHIHD